MKVILLENVKGSGKKFDVVNVSDGYAANYLFPKKLAQEATKENLSKLASKNDSEAFKHEQMLEEAKELSKKLSDKKIVIRTKSGENGKLFGAVTSKEISETIQSQLGLKIDKKKISMSEPIKTLGARVIDIKLHAEVTAQICLEIISDN